MHICLFDIDGTLISSGGAGKKALEAAVVETFGITHALETLSLSGRTDLAILHDVLRLHGIEETQENWQRLSASYLKNLPAALASGSGRILPGIAELLDHLKDREDVGVGLLTGNIRAGARVKLGHFGLFEYFAFGGYGDRHLDRDDVAREAFEEVRNRWNGTVRSDRIWVIGDTPLDVRCARAIGAQVVAVATGWHPREELAGHQPDLLFDDLSDAGPFLERLGA